LNELISPARQVQQSLGIGTAGPSQLPAAEPKNASPRTVTDTASLSAALAAAKPGDVITLKKGTYAGTLALDASGTESSPIVIRGEEEESTILDGMGGSTSSTTGGGGGATAGTFPRNGG
jgi:hypothetical protein